MEEKIKKNFSVYVGKFNPEHSEEPKESYQTDDEADAKYKAKAFCNNYDQVEVVNNVTGASLARYLRRTDEDIPKM